MGKYGVSVLKKFFLIIVALTTLLSASDSTIEQKIYKVIIEALVPNQETIRVWSDDKKYSKLLSSVDNIIFINNPNDADFLLLDHYHKGITHARGVIFVTNLQLLEDMQKSAVGGFFWQKGRPNILFLRQNLRKEHITLPNSMQEYIEDEL
jgi:hypothetical protein